LDSRIKNPRFKKCTVHFRKNAKATFRSTLPLVDRTGTPKCPKTAAKLLGL